LRLHQDDTKSNVIVTALRFESESEGGSARPAVVAPCAAATNARIVARPIAFRGGFGGIEIGIDAAGKLGVIPVSAPLVGVVVHVVDVLWICGKATDPRSLPERWT